MEKSCFRFDGSSSWRIADWTLFTILDRLETAADLTLYSRLGCHCIVKGDVVEIPAWNRNYISEGGASILGDAIPPPKKPQSAEVAQADSLR